MIKMPSVTYLIYSGQKDSVLKIP